jgi:hypothetical protein
LMEAVMYCLDGNDVVVGGCRPGSNGSGMLIS